MKTSILVSSIAAFFLMITFGGTPSYMDAEHSYQVSTYDFTNYKTNMLSHTTALASVAYRTEETQPTAQAIPSDDFNYLKFNVADYPETEEAAKADLIALPVEESDFSYLKFNVAGYLEDEYDYLKFDVSDYTSENSLSSDDNIELPATDLEYLKFDADNFMNDAGTVEIDELPENEFDSLKFDVKKFYVEYKSTEEMNIELPQAE